MGEEAIAPRPVTNFGRTVTFTPCRAYAPATEAEVLEVLDRHARGKVRVVGARHSWNDGIVTDDALIDLRHFDGVQVAADGTATVGGGCRIKHALRKLHALGDFTLPTIGLITEQTVAGAVSTATHGSGRGSFSHVVTGLRVAAYDAAGNARIYDWTDTRRGAVRRFVIDSMESLNQAAERRIRRANTNATPQQIADALPAELEKLRSDLRGQGINDLSVVTRKFEIVCEELCGAGHGTMRGEMYMVSADEYRHFLNLTAKPGSPATRPTSQPARQPVADAR